MTKIIYSGIIISHNKISSNGSGHKFVIAVYRMITIKDGLETEQNFVPPMVIRSEPTVDITCNLEKGIGVGAYIVVETNKNETESGVIIYQTRVLYVKKSFFDRLQDKALEDPSCLQRMDAPGALFETAYRGNVNTEHNSAVVYAEDWLINEEHFDSHNRQNAEEYAQKNHGTLLTQTEAYRIMRVIGFNYHDLKSPDFDHYLDQMAKRFIQAASGNITVFADGDVDPHNRFSRIILPAIMENPQIVTVNGKPKNEYAEAFRS